MNKQIFKNQLPRKGANIETTYYPKTPEEIENIVTKSSPILAVGKNNVHSRINETRTKTTFISSERIKHIYKVNPQTLDFTHKLKKRLTHLIDPMLMPREQHKFKDYFINVGAGVTLEELSDYLKARNLALPIKLDCESATTVGGMSQTSCHGSGFFLGALTDYIVSIRIVLPEGIFATVEPHQKISKSKNILKNSDFFHSLCCSVGSFCFVYDLVLFVQDAVEYKTHAGLTNWLYFRPDLYEFVEDVRNLDLFIDPSTSVIKVVQSGDFLKPFNYPKAKQMKELSGVYVSSESALPIYDKNDFQAHLNYALHYIREKNINCYPLHIRFGASSRHYLSPTYSDEALLGFMYIKMSVDLEKNADRNLRDLTNFETFLSSRNGKVNMAYIQGGVTSNPGIENWAEVYKKFDNNPFKISLTRLPLI